MLKRMSNIIVIGAIGPSTKVKYFTKEEYQNHLAPIHAKVEQVTVNGKKLIRMVY